MLRRMIEAKAIAQENRQLKAALQLARAQRARGRQRADRRLQLRKRRGGFAILSVGASDGVRVGMPVRAPDGLIGRVVEAGALASRGPADLRPRQHRAGAAAARRHAGDFDQGRGDGTIDLRPLEVGRNPFRRGDIVVTSGTGGLYPPLVPVARVVRLDDDGAIAVPLADPADTSFAVVEAPYRAKPPIEAAHGEAADGPRRPRARAARSSGGPRPYAAAVPAGLGRRRIGCWPSCRSSPQLGWYPDFGFLVLIAWRLLRRIWPAWWARAARPRQRSVDRRPLGQSVALWTATMLVLDLSRPPDDVARLLDRLGARGGC